MVFQKWWLTRKFYFSIYLVLRNVFWGNPLELPVLTDKRPILPIWGPLGQGGFEPQESSQVWKYMLVEGLQLLVWRVLTVVSQA